MAGEAATIVADAVPEGVIVKQNVRAGRDAYVAGRDMTRSRPGE
jgi:hypothetical protein